MMRLFVAVLLSEEARTDALRVQERLREAMGENGIRWVSPEQFHFTLKFLGDTDAAELPAIAQSAQNAAEAMAPFTLSLAGVGVFPQQRSPQVLWIGAKKGIPHLTRLAECLNRELEMRGYAVETKPYHPHLTLARMKTREGEEAVARTLPMFAEGTAGVTGQSAFTVRDFVLMESELNPGGPRYTTLKTFAFGAKKE